VPKLRAVLAANLERLRAERNLEKQDLARRAGMPASSLSRYLAKKQSATLDVIERLAEALGTTPSVLLDDGTQAPPVLAVEHPLSECVARVSRAALGATEEPKMSAELEAILDTLENGEGEDFDRAYKKLRAMLAREDKRRA
jgi:transcriptional regulator with XRE-family HTH domain